MRVVENLRRLLGNSKFNVVITPESNPRVVGMNARQLYATQANLHTVITFIADSIAQLPIKVYRRNEENDRERVRNDVAALLLTHPNSDQTTYEFINALMIEYLLMGDVCVWLLPDDSESGYQLRVIPREWIISEDFETNYAPKSITINAGGGIIEIPREQFINFRMYNPGNPGGYQSPIASLKQTLTEQVQADRFRTQIWSSSGRFNAYITRPKDVVPWDEGTRTKWVEAFRAGWGGGGSNAGKIPLLEDGMEIKPYQFNAKESQYAETKQLSREDVAAAYHINPSLIWHTTTQTYASAKDNARALYADCLGSILQMLQQRINSFLLPLIGADPNIYIEFDLREKLKGSFEERASILQSAVGAPYMTRNEARADSNMPPIEGGDELIVPLNLNDGINNYAIEEPEDEEKSRKLKAKAEELRIKSKSSEEEDDYLTECIADFLQRQSESVLPKIGAKADWWDAKRWDEELTDDLLKRIKRVSGAHGNDAADKLGVDFNPGRTVNYLKAMAAGRATAINKTTYKRLKKAVDSDDEEPSKVFETRKNKDSISLGRAIATATATFATLEAVDQARYEGVEAQVYKTWVTGYNARESHALMNGETVPIDDAFSNGAEWPGDDNLDPEETCNCNCSTDILIRF